MNRNRTARIRCAPGKTALCALLLSATILAQARAQNSPSSERIRRAVVELLAVGPGEKGKNRECGATGFLVNAQGYILTNAHVVEEARHCLEGSPGAKLLAKPATPHPSVGNAVSCNLVGLDELHDLAVLKAERPLFETSTQNENNFVLLSPAEVEEGAEVAVTGHPAFAWQPLTQSGRVAGQGSLPLSDHSAATSKVLILDIALRKGTSGSPVYRPADGGVVGIVERKDVLRPSHTVAVPIRYAIEMLDRAGVEWHAGRK